jgi:hypothetical protein
MYKSNHKNLLLVVLLSTLLTSLNAYALEERPAPELLIKDASYLDLGAARDGGREVLIQVEKSAYADRIEIAGNDHRWAEASSLLDKAAIFFALKDTTTATIAAVLAPQAKTVTIKAIGKTREERVERRLVWDWGWESKKTCIEFPWWLGGGLKCKTVSVPKLISQWLPGYNTFYKYEDQEVVLTLEEQISHMPDFSLSLTRKASDPEQMVISSQFQPVTNAQSYQQVCTSDDGHTLSASTTDFDQNSLQATVEHYGRSYRCTVSATIKSPRDVFKEFDVIKTPLHQLLNVSLIDSFFSLLDSLIDSSLNVLPDHIRDELPSYLRDGSEVTLVSAEQVIDVPVQHRYAFNQDADQAHYAYHAYPTQVGFEEALAEAQFCHSAWCLDLGNGDTLVLYSDYNLPVDQRDQDSNRHAYTYTLYIANFDDDQITPQVLHQISTSKQLAKMIPLDSQPLSDTNVYSVLLSYRDKNVADMVHITENLDEREEGSLATIYAATSTHIVPIDSNDSILAMPVFDSQVALEQTLLATYNSQTAFLSVQGYDHQGNLIESDYISGVIGDLILPLDRLWIDHHDTTQDTAQDTTENRPLRSLNIVDNHGTYARFTGAENALYISELIDDANRKPLTQLTTSGEQCKNYYLDEVEDETRFLAYPNCMLADHTYISANNQKHTYLSSHNNSHNHQLACYQDNDATTEDATTEKVHCHRHHPIVGLHNPRYDFIDVETNSLRVKNIMLQPDLDTSSSIGRYPTYIQEINNKNNNDKFMVAFRPTTHNNFDINWNIYTDGFILKRGEKYFGSSLALSKSESKDLKHILDFIGYDRGDYIDMQYYFGLSGEKHRQRAKNYLNDLVENLSQFDRFQDVHIVNSPITGSQLFAFLIKDLKYPTTFYLKREATDTTNYIEYNKIMNGQYSQGIKMSPPTIWPMKNDTYIYRIPFCVPNSCFYEYSAYIKINGHDNKVAFDQLMPRYDKDRILPPSSIAFKVDENKIQILQVGKDVQLIEKQEDTEGGVNYVLTVVRGNNAGVVTRTIGATDPQHERESAESIFNSLLSQSQAGALLDDQLQAQIEPLYAPVKAKGLLAEWFSAISTQQTFPITNSSQLWSKTASMISEKVGTDITGLDDTDGALRHGSQLKAIAQLAGLSMPELNSHLSSLLDGTTVFDDQLMSNLKAEVNHIKQAIGLSDEAAQIIERSIKEQWELVQSASEQKIDAITAELEDSIAGLYLPEGSDSDYKFYQLNEGNNETTKDLIAMERTEKSIEWVVAREGRLPNVSLRIDRDNEKNKLDLWIDGKPFQIAPLVYKYPDQEIVSSLGSLLSRLQDFIDIAAEGNASNGQLTDKFNQLDRQVLLSYRTIFCPPTSTAHGPIVGEGSGYRDSNANDADNNAENLDTNGHDIQIPNERERSEDEDNQIQENNDICRIDIQASDIESSSANSARELIELNQPQIVDQVNQPQIVEQVGQHQQIGQIITELFRHHLHDSRPIIQENWVIEARFEINPRNPDQDGWFARIGYRYHNVEHNSRSGMRLPKYLTWTVSEFQNFATNEQIIALKRRGPVYLVENYNWNHINCENLPSCFERVVGAMRKQMPSCRSINCVFDRYLLIYNFPNLAAPIVAGTGHYIESVVTAFIITGFYFYNACIGNGCSPSTQDNQNNQTIKTIKQSKQSNNLVISTFVSTFLFLFLFLITLDLYAGTG